MSAVSISEAAALIGVTPATLRRWELEGRLQPSHRTLGNHRRYRLCDLERLFDLKPSAKPRKIVLYARVSSHDQRDDLVRQSARLKAWAQANSHLEAECLEDLGSGLNYKKRGLKKLLRLLVAGEVGTLVLTHKDRLLRFGSELIFQLCATFNTRVVVIEAEQDVPFEQALVQDVLEMMVVYSARLYGRRSHENRRRKQRAA